MAKVTDSTTTYSTPAFVDTMALEDSTMFGSKTELVTQSIDAPTQTPLVNAVLTDNTVYQVSLIMLFILFFANTYRYSELLGLLLKVITRKSFLERLYSERSNLFKQYMRNTTIIGGVLIALLAVRVFQGYFIEQSLEFLEDAQMLTLAAMAIVILISLYRFIITRILAIISNQVDFFKKHNYISNIYWVVGTNLIAPLFIFGANYHNLTGEIILEIILLFSVFTLILYLYNSFLFFIKQKVSNLQWILYLCAVDIFPVSLIIALWKI